MPIRGGKAETQFTDWASSQGWMSLHRGWPDYLCIKPDGSVIVVEVKGKDNERLSRHQEDVMTILADLGMPTFKWTPDSGLNYYHANRKPVPHPFVAPSQIRRFTLSERIMVEYFRLRERLIVPPTRTKRRARRVSAQSMELG